MSHDPYAQSPAPYGAQPAPYGQGPYGGQPARYGGAPGPTSVQATNTKAVVALCLGFSAPLVGLVFGILALREIGRTGEGGKGFAITGVVLGVLLLLFLVAYVGLIIAVISSAMSGGAMSSDLFGS